MAILDSVTPDPSSPLMAAMRPGDATDRTVNTLDITQGDPQQQQMAPSPDTPDYSPQQSSSAPSGPGMGNFFTDPKNSQLLLAMAGGLASGKSPLAGLGEAFTAGNEQIQKDKQLAQQHEQAMAMLGLGKDKLAETSRVNTGKISELVARTQKEGMPMVKNMGDGTYAVMHPGDAAPQILTNDEYQRFASMIADKHIVAAQALMGTRLQANELTNTEQQKEDASIQSAMLSKDQTLQKIASVRARLMAGNDLNPAEKLLAAANPKLLTAMDTEGGKTYKEFQGVTTGAFSDSIKSIGGGRIMKSEVDQLNTPQPAATDSTAVKLAWLDNQEKYLRQGSDLLDSYKANRDAGKAAVMGLPGGLQNQGLPPSNAASPSAAPVAAPVARAPIPAPTPGAAPMVQQYPAKVTQATAMKNLVERNAASDAADLTSIVNDPSTSAKDRTDANAQLQALLKSRPGLAAATAPKVADAPPPAAALAQLKEGTNTTFRNGQVWTLKNGQPMKVK